MIDASSTDMITEGPRYRMLKLWERNSALDQSEADVTLARAI